MEHFEKYLNLIYRYLAIRNRSEKEIRDYLTKKNIDSQVIEQIVNLLKEKKFLNDESFARSWIAQRARFRPKGKRMLRFELQQKGIDRDLIDKVMAEEHEDIPDELAQARSLVEKRLKKFRGEPRQEIYRKISAFLARRGFSWETSKKAIESGLAEKVA